MKDVIAALKDLDGNNPGKPLSFIWHFLTTQLRLNFCYANKKNKMHECHHYIVSPLKGQRERSTRL